MIEELFAPRVFPFAGEPTFLDLLPPGTEKSSR